MMLVVVWAFVLPTVLAALASYWLSKRLFLPKSTYRAMIRAREVIMSENELEKAREGKAVRYVMNLISRLQKTIDLEYHLLSDIRNMLKLMGFKKSAEKELAGYVLYALIGALPVLTVPVLTRFYGYFALYPPAAAFLIFQQYQGLKKKYHKWQTEIIKDLPELIDKLRISFASGRDYISAFNQVGKNSSSRMGRMIDKLINDLQCMRPTSALDLFADAFKMPVVTKFTSAVKIAIEYGYESAENYFNIIEADVTELRKVAIEELTRSKPEKVYQLYLIMLSLAIGTLILKGWEIFSQINKIM